MRAVFKAYNKMKTSDSVDYRNEMRVNTSKNFTLHVYIDVVSSLNITTKIAISFNKPFRLGSRVKCICKQCCLCVVYTGWLPIEFYGLPTYILEDMKDE